MQNFSGQGLKIFVSFLVKMFKTRKFYTHRIWKNFIICVSVYHEHEVWCQGHCFVFFSPRWIVNTTLTMMNRTRNMKRSSQEIVCLTVLLGFKKQKFLINILCILHENEEWSLSWIPIICKYKKEIFCLCWELRCFIISEERVCQCVRVWVIMLWQRRKCCAAAPILLQDYI